VGWKIENGNGTNEASITAGELHARLTQTEADAGFAAVLLEQDSGSANGGTRRTVTLEGTQDYRGRVAIDTNGFDEPFPGTALASGPFVATVSTMAVAVSSGILTFNSGNSVASGAVARVQTWASFPMYGGASTYVEVRARLSSFQTNSVAEIGVGYASGVTTPTVGAYFKYDGASLNAVVNFNGAEDSIAVAGGSIPTANTFANYIVEWSETAVVFWIDNAEVARYEIPASSPAPTICDRLPVLIRQYNSAAVSIAAQLAVGRIVVQLGETQYGYNSASRAALAGRTLIQGQVTQPQGSMAGFTNSVAPSTASLSNVTPSYTTPGGKFLFTAPAGAETDYALFGWQNPAGSATTRGQTLLVRRCRIDAVNIGAAVATTATIIEWGIGADSSTASLVTVESATAHAARRLALGVQSWIVGAAIGAPAEAIDVEFNPPLAVHPGNYLHIIMRSPVGTATASQQIRGSAMLQGEYV